MLTKDLKITVAIARLEGLKPYVSFRDGASFVRVRVFGGITRPKPYDPFDWAVLGPLLCEYKVEMRHSMGLVVIARDLKSAIMSPLGWNEQDMKRAALKCILELNGVDYDHE